MREHDFKTLDPPLIISWVTWAGIGPKPIPVRQNWICDRECRRCGASLEKGEDPAKKLEDWKDCDLTIVRFVMTC